MDQWTGGLESLVIDPDFWSGRRVFLTGHTGFKGAWTALLLRSLGADVHGFALAPASEHCLFCVAQIEQDVHHRIGDVRDIEALRAAVAEAAPDIVIHMAAQALVRSSYDAPVDTYATNVMGTVNLLEAVRHQPGVRAVVVVTSDKCYENDGGRRPFQETDAMGGHDPYSSSKGCAEIVCAAYRRSFFGPQSSLRLATARAGNVIGGGDWAVDRLVPDIMRSFMAGQAVLIRNPQAVRPWQHVLDPVIGYLALAEHLAAADAEFAEGWNFGPGTESEVSVAVLVERLARKWGENARWVIDAGEKPHEATYLTLDCSKAVRRLGWHPLFDFDQGLALTSQWYRAFHKGADMRATTLAQIETSLMSTIARRRAS